MDIRCGGRRAGATIHCSRAIFGFVPVTPNKDAALQMCFDRPTGMLSSQAGRPVNGMEVERMNRTTAVVLLALAATIPSRAEPDSEALLGLWEVVEIRDLTAGKTQAKRREFHMFTKSHEMIILAGSDRRKIKKSLTEMTADEVMSQQPIGAGFYHYEVKGDKLLRTNIVALSAYYEGSTFTTEFEIDGDTLITRDSHAADGHRREWRMRRVE